MPLFGSIGTEYHVPVKRSDGSTKIVIMKEKEYQAYKREKAAAKARIQDVDPVRDTASRRRATATERDAREPARGARTSEIRDDYNDRPAPRTERSKRKSSQTESRTSKEPSRSSKTQPTRSTAPVAPTRTKEETIPGRAPAPSVYKSDAPQPTAAQNARLASSRNTVHVSTSEVSSTQTRKVYAVPKETAISYADYGSQNISSYSRRPEELYAPAETPSAPAATRDSKPAVKYLTPAEVRRMQERNGANKTARTNSVSYSATSSSSGSIPQRRVDTSNDEYLARLLQEEMNLSAEPEPIEGYDPRAYGEDVPRTPSSSSRAAEKASARDNAQSAWDRDIAQQLQNKLNGVQDAVIVVEESDDENDDNYPKYIAAQYERNNNGASSSRSRTYSFNIAGDDEFPSYDSKAFEAASSRNSRAASSKVVEKVKAAPRQNITLVNSNKNSVSADRARSTIMDAMLRAGVPADSVEQRRKKDFEKYESAMGGASDHFLDVYNQVIGNTQYRQLVNYDRNYPSLSTSEAKKMVTKFIDDELAYYRDRRDFVSEIRKGLDRTCDTSEFAKEVVCTFDKTPPEMMVDIFSYAQAKCNEGDRRYNIMDGLFGALKKIGTIDYEHRSDGSVYEVHCARGQVEAFVEPLQGYMALKEVSDKELTQELLSRFKDFVSEKNSSIKRDLQSGDNVRVSNQYRNQFIDKMNKDIVRAKDSIVPRSQLDRIMNGNAVWPVDFDLDYMVD